MQRYVRLGVQETHPSSNSALRELGIEVKKKFTSKTTKLKQTMSRGQSYKAFNGGENLGLEVVQESLLYSYVRDCRGFFRVFF